MATSALVRRSLVVGLASQGAGDYVADRLDIVADLTAAETALLEGVVAGTFAADKVMALNSGGDGTMPEGGDIALGTTTGSKLGTAATQKLGLWGVTPVIQPKGADQGVVTAPAAYLAHASGAVAVLSAAATDLDTTAAALAALTLKVAALTTLVLAMRTADIAVGTMKGSA